jgi:purine nucleosidase
VNTLKRRIIIDCDPGVDDAVALLWAFAARDKFEIAAITTVTGNVGLEATTRNACILREIAGREDVEVFAGCQTPLLRAPVAAEHFHGESGLGGLVFSPPRKGPSDTHAVNAIIDLIMTSPTGSISLAVTGPMTNIAMALRIKPAIAGRLREVVIMGGARIEGGNITASSEFNIHADPHAAAIVYGSGVPIIAIGLDASHQVRTNAERMARLKAIPGPYAATAHDLLVFGEHVERTLAGHDGAPFHDQSVIAYLLAPELFETVPATIIVETNPGIALGHTSVELRGAQTSKTRWATRVDAEALFERFLTDLGNAPQ